jgi:HEAT repeat protein
VGLFDFITGGSGPEKANKLKAKVTQRYGDPVTRQKAIAQLAEMKTPEAVSALMARFTITVEPQTTDADEKDNTFEYVRAMGQDAVPPVKDFLARSEQASSWAIRMLEELLPQVEVVGICAQELARLGAAYTRNPEKKVVLLNYLTGKDDPRIPPAVVALLEDMSDDVKIAALKALGPLKYEPAREPMLKLLTTEDTARRVQTHALAALAESGFGVQGYREKVEALAGEGYVVDKSGLLKKRS